MKEIRLEYNRERKTIIVFITKQMIKSHLDDYIHRAVNILQTGKKRVKLPWVIAVRHFAFIISLIVERHSAVRECIDDDTSV
jgi:hypothetical protein